MNMDIKKIKSGHPLTPFAPSWDISLGSCIWEDETKIDKISEFLLYKEKEILNLPMDSKVGIPKSVGLGNTDVTTRYGQYNLFDYANELEELNDLLDFLRLAYLNYVGREFVQARNLTFVCWYNILRKGQTIDLHRHGTNPQSYLSGHFQFNDCNSETYYQVPYEGTGVAINNPKGQVTIFPSSVLHGVLEYKDEPPRISLAFDMHCTEYRNSYPELNQRTFMNDEIYKRLMM